MGSYTNAEIAAAPLGRPSSVPEALAVVLTTTYETGEAYRLDQTDEEDAAELDALARRYARACGLTIQSSYDPDTRVYAFRMKDKRAYRKKNP